MINYTINRYRPSTIGGLEYYMENPETIIRMPKGFYLSKGTIEDFEQVFEGKLI